MENSKKYKILSTFDLKIIGIILMLIDHIHQMFVPMGIPNWLDWFGRPVAILFFFISVEGFIHTRSKIRYIMRLYICMILMSFCTIQLENVVGYDEVTLMNNIFRDLLVGCIMMYGIYFIQEGWKSKKVIKLFGGIFLFLIPILTSILFMYIMTNNVSPVLYKIVNLIPALLLTENNYLVLIIPIMYIFRKKRMIQCGFIMVASLVFFFLGSTQWMMIFAIIPILLYNGEKGKGLKYFFYIFYPTHIWVLYLISYYVYTR